MKLRGKRVFLTGASSGLGAALARAAVGRGASCTLAARRVDRLHALARSIASENPSRPVPQSVFCDLSDRASIAGALYFAEQRMGGIDLLINNAGISVYGGAERTPEADLEKLLRVNFLGCVHAMQEVLPCLRRQGGGLIVNVASIAALYGVPYLAAYGASKAALANFSQSLRAELEEEGIGIQVVYPDYIQTPIFENEKKLGDARRPSPPYASADEVAEEILDRIESEQRESILGSRGRMMRALRGILPGMLDRAMRRMAASLKERGELR